MEQLFTSLTRAIEGSPLIALAAAFVWGILSVVLSPCHLASTQAAKRILAIDGCPLACAKNTLEKAEVTRFQHVQLADLGMAKGKSPVSEDRVAKAADAGLAALGSQEAVS